MSFSELPLIEPLRRALAAEGYLHPTPIQVRAIPPVLEGKDLLGCAQTGTGKTAAFSLPLLQRLAERPSTSKTVRALVLSPTRELAAQIGERIDAYGKHLGQKSAVIYGGVSQMHQVRALRAHPSIVVATPGRLLDLCQQKLVDLSRVEILVLDEADRMLDMGFIHDVRRIVAMTPKSRQTLFFSATMPPDIVALGKSILRDPVRVDVAPATKTADKIQQAVYFVPRPHKRELLERLLRDRAVERVLVFARTKHGANRISQQLERAKIPAAAIHGDKSQGARERALENFRSGATRVLVATDIAARGIDVDGVSHVVNYDLPAVAESYVHRIGRTARAGASGIAFSLCDDEERPLLAGIEKLLGARIPVLEHGLTGVEAAAPWSGVAEPARQEHKSRGGSRHGSPPRSGGQNGRRFDRGGTSGPRPLAAAGAGAGGEGGQRPFPRGSKPSGGRVFRPPQKRAR